MKSADVRHDWTWDAYINSALAHIIESEPELGKPLERKSGLELLDPKSGRAIPLQSLHLLDTHKFAQLWAIDSVYCDVIATDIEALWGENAANAVDAARYVWFTDRLDNPGVERCGKASYADAQRYRDFKEMLKQKRAESSEKIRPDLSPESAEEMIQKIVSNWKDQK
ncbi:hypothetical protein [Pantoea sp.]|uniref:hypothetical protein n=1 Tax=Pantoea sp. TaxID=69393 RepID=UPI0028AF583A|nr:hypothetical protein [Pantoea sp.]